MKKLVVKKSLLVENIDKIKSMTSAKVIAVMKCNAYGLDILKYASLMLENGIDFFAVADIDEAILLRKNNFTNDILLLSPVMTKDLSDLLVQNNLTATVTNVECARLLSNSAEKFDKKVQAHIKIDTGFGRYGINRNIVEEVKEIVKNFDNIAFKGIYSHFSSSFLNDKTYTKKQFDMFQNIISLLDIDGIDFELKHIANSSAFIKYPEMHLDAVRVGSAFLGRLAFQNNAKLNKIGYLESNIAYINTLPTGHNIGYANVYTAKRDTTTGIIPIGYYDGFGTEKSKDIFNLSSVIRYMIGDFKLLNKKLYVEINNKKIPILGRVGMHNIVVDLTGTNIKIDDKVKCETNPILLDSGVLREYR